MKVIMLKPTTYQGPREVGKEYDIDDAVAKRWIERKLAEPAASDAAKSYSKMKAKALYELCLEKGLEVEEKQPKEYYIEALIKAEAASDDNVDDDTNVNDGKGAADDTVIE